MKGKKIGYKRVSTAEQNPDRQLEGMPLDKVFIEYASGKSVKRPELYNLLDYVREDDIIYIHSIDRLARNVRDLYDIVDKLLEKKCSIHFVKQNIIFDGNQSAMSNLLFLMLGAIAEFEYSLIKERQLEGIAIAKKEGRYKGKVSKINKQMIETIKEKMKTRLSKKQIAKDLGISRITLYHILIKINKEEESNASAST